MNPSVGESYINTVLSPEQTLPLVSRGHPVAEVTPAKKITFYKSGDPQFGGVKMAISRRSFKSVSALMDDLSHRVPLPFGVRTITTPRGTHSINKLEQLVDGGTYICSDKKYVQPIAPSKPSRKMVAHQPGPPVNGRKQSRQDEQEEGYSATQFQPVPKLRKKITLVKNADPTVRRSVILNRTNGRNMKTFLQDASDILQYTVRRLYTADGRRIENMHEVLQSPSILICAGREPFKRIQLENVRKSISEKLPGLHTHQNFSSEAMDNKRNVNFGVKAKKSVIHPRPLSSSKTRFSLSSEKSFPNGLNMSPVNSGYSNSSAQAKSEDSSHSLLNEDIEKKVHVNKDGSLSVEMKVRFRLLNEETLQWSTQIKKSSNLGKAKCEQICLCDHDETTSNKEMNPELFSETDDSFYPCDAESYSSKLHDEDVCCAHCGMQSRQYDIWKNPMHVNQQEGFTKRDDWQPRSSASSTSSHHKVIRNKKRSTDCPRRTSSEEYTEHIVHQSSHYSETKDNRETRVMYSAISQCTTHSSQSTAASNREATTENENRSRRKSQTSLGNQSSLQNLCSVSENLRRTENMTNRSCSSEEWSESSTRSSPSDTPNKDKHRNTFNGTSDLPVKSSKRHRKIKKKEIAEIVRGHSNISLISTDRQESPGETNECREQLLACSTTSRDETDNGQENEQPGLNSPRTCFSQCEKYTSKSSSHSVTQKKKAVGKNSSQKSIEKEMPHSPCSSVNPKQSSNIVKSQNGSSTHCKMPVQLGSPSNSEKNCGENSETQEVRPQSQSSFQSISSLTECKSCHEQEGHPSTKDSVGNDECKTDDDIISAESETQPVIPRHRSSSLTKAGKSYSTSSKASSNFNKECKLVSEDNSPNDTKTKTPNQNRSLKSSDCESNSVYSPTPPQGKPSNRHLRLAALKYSHSSDSADITNGGNPGCSRSTTPVSGEIFTAKDSTETCKKMENTLTSNKSAEEILNHLRRTGSSSSLKKKLRNKSLDSVKTSSDLTPSALPNVTSEEVVHEWLKKIPPHTLEVDYEVEESQSKISERTENLEMENKQETGEKEDQEAVKETSNSSQDLNQTINELNCINGTNDLPERTTSDRKEDISLQNGINNDGTSTITGPACDEKIFSRTINTSVQIMKALLYPLQESKFDRSNSLPEVSPSVGRKLSKSARVLISCLASVELLDEDSTDNMIESKVLDKPKYTELLGILQNLWVDTTENKQSSKAKSDKNGSTDTEETPVSSSGVDVNSGYEGSGDGSITGGVVTPEKVEENQTPVAQNLENKNKDSQLTEPAGVIPEQLEAENLQSAKLVTTCVVMESSPILNEVKSCYVDENMNENILVDNESNTEQVDPTNYVNDVTEIKEELTQNTEHTESRNDGIDIVSHTENNLESNEANSDDTNEISSKTDVQSNIISTSDSNGRKGQEMDKHVDESDPMWTLKLLKKIENEFMAHYVDAMNEFKIRWNLENNENLEEMIAELKTEVGKRIQKSIANELKKLKNRAGQKIPRALNQSNRRSSLQAEERRRRLQTMHKRSGMPNGDYSKDFGTNDISTETDEEDLTFSASFGEDTNGLVNSDEFCPCETCIKKKKALKLAKPKPVVSDAPITRAFDLQQILKTKKEIITTVNDNMANQQEELNDPVNENGCTDEYQGSSVHKLEKQNLSETSDHSEGDNKADKNDLSSIVEENEECSDFLDKDNNVNDELDQNEEEKAEEHFETEPEDKSNTYNGEEESEQKPNPSDINNTDRGLFSAVEQEEVKETLEDTHERVETCSNAEKIEDENKLTVPGIQQRCVDLLETYDSNLQKLPMAQSSLVTHQGSVGDVEEVSSNLDLNDKQNQMYPDSSSEGDCLSSRGASPVNVKGNKMIEGARTEGCTVGSQEQITKEDIMEENDFDF
ncbi:hypothetical protein GDO86_010572 [Hymenochirus boettgeri]|uniref:Doublecortin domain-containing protein n=1 Tax=Hymenochirus boettgeri TaxID=247094 RepID=A0A8T2JQJ8_9PIPI|nr:hypothetical protein GDO86_010572 [Hymenochirus boettgeri]